MPFYVRERKIKHCQFKKKIVCKICLASSSDGGDASRGAFGPVVWFGTSLVGLGKN